MPTEAIYLPLVLSPYIVLSLAILFIGNPEKSKR